MCRNRKVHIYMYEGAGDSNDNNGVGDNDNNNGIDDNNNIIY